MKIPDLSGSTSFFLLFPGLPDMHLSLLTITALAGELNENLMGKVVASVQPLEGMGLCLCLSRNARSPALCLITHRDLFTPFLCTNPQPGGPVSSFLLNLRRHLPGQTIVSVDQWREDRILRVQMQKADEILGNLRRTLVLELVPRHQNIILLDAASGIILDAFRRVGGQMSRHRQILPGQPYAPPPVAPGLHPIRNSPEECLQTLRRSSSRSLAEAFGQCFPWATPYLLGKLSSALDLNPELPVEKIAVEKLLGLVEGTKSLIEELQKTPSQPTLILGREGREQTLLPYQPGGLPEERKHLFDNLSQALEQVYVSRCAHWQLEGQKRKLGILMRRALHRNRRALKHLEADQAHARGAEQFRLLGDVISANIGRLKRGLSQARLPNPYSEHQEMIAVPLDPKLTPVENAQHYFKHYRKAKTGLPKIRRRLQAVSRLLEKLEDLRIQLDQVADRERMAELKGNLASHGIHLPIQMARSPDKETRERRQPLTFTLDEGWTVWVGRNNRDNEHLTHRLAEPGDLWFHAQGVPGSHVILRRAGRKDAPSRRILEEVASLAAHFSRARHSGTVPVVYTERRHVRKPRGAQPGLVIVQREKTLFVKPELPAQSAQDEK